jgi:hypothetical protein
MFCFLPETTKFFPAGPDTFGIWSVCMDKATRTQLSIGLFIVGFIMIFIQDLKRLDTINLGFSWPFAIMFYLGLIFMATGYYLK